MEKFEIQEDYITVIGGINIDISGFTNQPLILRDSNIGKVRISPGGVGRNIAENISKLGITTKLLSVLGDDAYGQSILMETPNSRLDLKEVCVAKGCSTSIYLSVMDENRDMAVAVNSMDIMELLDKDYLDEKYDIIKDSMVCVLDTNLSSEMIEYILLQHKTKTFFLDPVSTKKAWNIRSLIGNFHTIKPNKLEAEILIGNKLDSPAEIRQGIEYFLSRGVKQVFITLGAEGIIYGNQQVTGQIKSNTVDIVNATGAGDAFTAALVYGYLNKMEIGMVARLAIAASVVALSHEKTINPGMSIDTINKKMEELIYDETIFVNQ